MYAVHTLPGLERIAWQAVRRAMPDAKRVAELHGLLLFSGPPHGEGVEQLTDLRVTEDLFVVLHHQQDMATSRKGLHQIRSAILRPANLDQAMQVYNRLPHRRVRRITFRVIAQQQGHHAFRRVDARDEAIKALYARTDGKWKLMDEEAHLEVWVDIQRQNLTIMIRLSDQSMRQRDYKRAHIPASLRPCAAAAMVSLSDPQEGERILDPMCGAGTLLLERKDVGPARVLGGDVEREAIEASLANGLNQPGAAICRWDARLLPLPDNAIDKVLCNLPFGIQLGSHEENVSLYERVLREMTRVLRVGGMAVLLSGEEKLMETVLDGLPLHLQRLVPITLLGRPAAIYVLYRS